MQHSVTRNVAVTAAVLLSVLILSAPCAIGQGNVWHSDGNRGTNPATDFLGTTDPVSLVVRTKNTPRLIIDPTGLSQFLGNVTLQKDLAVQNNATIQGNLGVQSNLSVQGVMALANAMPSTSPNSGALVVGGGAGIGGNLNVGVDANIGRNLNLSGGANIVNTLTVGGATTVKNLNVNGPANFTAGATVGGTLTVNVLTILGGGDLAEPFNVKEAEITKPGTIVSIDPDKPGVLRLSSRSYDRAVAGIISGANGIRPGMTLQHTGTPADGGYPVALSGRVWAYADADSGGAIHPGDLLTTSSMPGYAMKVTDYSLSQGAVLGKAMSALECGRGMVLVLVSLQ